METLTLPTAIPETQTEPRYPDWRWSAAKNGRRQEEDATDPILRETREFCAALDDLTVRSRAIVKKYPDLSVAYCIHEEWYRYSLRWVIELYATAGWDNARISAEVQGAISEGQIDLYRRVFYDVDGYRDDADAMERFVLRPARQRAESQPQLEETDLFYKQQAGDLPFLMVSTGLPSHASQAVSDWCRYPVDYRLGQYRLGCG